MKILKKIPPLLLIFLLIPLFSWTSKKQKELEAEINQLKKQNLELKKEIDELKAQLELLLSRLEQLEKLCKASAQNSPSAQSSAKKPAPSQKIEIEPFPKLPVVKVEPEAKEPEKKTKPKAIVIDLDKKGKVIAQSDEAQLKSEILNLLEDEEFESALDLIKAQLATKPNARFSCWLLFHKAKAESGLGKDELSSKTYLELADKYPACDYAPEAIFRSAQIYEKKKNYAKAKELYKEIISLYPFSEYANLAKKKLKE